MIHDKPCCVSLINSLFCYTMSKRLLPFHGSDFTRAAFFVARPLFNIGSDFDCSPEETARFISLAHPFMVSSNFPTSWNLFH